MNIHSCDYTADINNFFSNEIQETPWVQPEESSM